MTDQDNIVNLGVPNKQEVDEAFYRIFEILDTVPDEVGIAALADAVGAMCWDRDDPQALFDTSVTGHMRNR